MCRAGIASNGWGRAAQVRVERLAADAHVAGNLALLLAASNAAGQLGNLVRAEGTLPATVGAALLRERDALTLALAQQGTLEFGERSHDRQHEVGHWRIVTGELQALFDELDAHPPFGQRLDDAAQVVEVARQPVHAVDDEGVALAHEPSHRLKLRAAGVLAGGAIGEASFDEHTVELSVRVLFERADADMGAFDEKEIKVR